MPLVYRKLICSQVLCSSADRPLRRGAGDEADLLRHLGWDDAGHVGVDAEQSRWLLDGHHVGDDGAPVAALRDVVGVAKAFHQLDPGRRDAVGGPAGVARLARVPVVRYRRDHHVEGVVGAAAVRGGVGERVDDPQQLDDRAGPAVRDDDRQRVLVIRADVDEVDVEAVDLGHEVRQRLQSLLAFAPVVRGGPVAREFLHHLQLHALGVVGDRLPVGPSGVLDARAQVTEFRPGGHRDRERSDRFCSRDGHVGLLGWCGLIGRRDPALSVAPSHRARGTAGFAPWSYSRVASRASQPTSRVISAATAKDRIEADIQLCGLKPMSRPNDVHAETHQET